MTCPTKNEYVKALGNKEFFCNAITRERKNRENLIDKLCDSQKILKEYESLLGEANEIIQKYEIYQEILTENRQ